MSDTAPQWPVALDGENTAFDPARCKICGHEGLLRVAHTAECRSCGAVMNYPYIDAVTLLRDVSSVRTTEFTERWISAAAHRNHQNFTDMIAFGLRDIPAMTPLKVLDYGGGSGQFASVMRSMYPNAQIWMTDASDAARLPQWSALSTQILFADFPLDANRFDAVFLNDVFEHVGDPVAVLQLLSRKLEPSGRIFIDTPRPFWLYPLLRRTAPGLHRRLLRATVDADHQQLWARRALEEVARRADLRIVQYKEIAEFTREPAFYLKTIGVRNPLVFAGGILFHRFAGTLRAHNKLMAVLYPSTS